MKFTILGQLEVLEDGPQLESLPINPPREQGPEVHLCSRGREKLAGVLPFGCPLGRACADS
jgi:hypothetical protein